MTNCSMEKLTTFKALCLRLDVDIRCNPVEVFDQNTGIVIRGTCNDIVLRSNDTIGRLVLYDTATWDQGRKWWTLREVRRKKSEVIRKIFFFSYEDIEFMEGPFITDSHAVLFACLTQERFVMFFPEGCRLPHRPCVYDEYLKCRHLITTTV